MPPTTTRRQSPNAPRVEIRGVSSNGYHAAAGVSASAPLAVLAAFLFGAALVVSRFGLRHAAPAQGAAVSVSSTMLLLWALSPLLLDPSGFAWGAAWIFAAVGLVYPALVTLLTFGATQRMGPTVTNATSSTAPLFAILFAVAFIGESLSATRAAGASILVLGVAALSWSPGHAPRQWPLWALALPLLASAVRGGALTLTKHGLNLWPEPFAASLIGYTVSAVVIVAAQATGGERPRALWRAALPWFAAVGMLNGIAVLTMYYALGKGEVGLVSPLVASSPLFTLLLSLAFLRDERIGWQVLLGVVLTVAGAGLVVQ